MKTKTILFTVMILSFLIGGSECDNKNEKPEYYSGEIISLNKGDACFDILKITQTPNDGLPIETRIAFNSNTLEKDLRIGDVVRFKINYYVEWTGPANASCLWPQYSASIELISN